MTWNVIRLEQQLMEINFSHHAELATKSSQIHYIIGRCAAEQVFIKYVYRTQDVKLAYRHKNYVVVSTGMPISLQTIKRLIANWAGCVYHRNKHGNLIIPKGEQWYWC